jgi:transposase
VAQVKETLELTERRTTQKKLYVGIDVSKLTLDICVIDDNEKKYLATQISNNTDGYKRLEKELKRAQEKSGFSGSFDYHFCLEATGIYSNGIVSFLLSKKRLVSVLNPYVSASFLKARLCRTKTDKVDAEGVALYALKMNPRAFKQAPEMIRVLQKEVRFLQSLIQKKTQFVREKESLSSEHKAIHDELILVMNSKIKKQQVLIQALIKKHAKLSEYSKCLQSIPGVGEQTAWIILSELMYDAESELPIEAKKQVAHAGLAPMERSSGSSVYAAPRISKTGNRILRKALFFPALTAIRHCDSIAKTYTHLINNGKRKKVALVACMRKLLALAVTLLQKQTIFIPHYISQRSPTTPII